MDGVRKQKSEFESCSRSLLLRKDSLTFYHLQVILDLVQGGLLLILVRPSRAQAWGELWQPQTGPAPACRYRPACLYVPAGCCGSTRSCMLCMHVKHRYYHSEITNKPTPTTTTTTLHCFKSAKNKEGYCLTRLLIIIIGLSYGCIGSPEPPVFISYLDSPCKICSTKFSSLILAMRFGSGIRRFRFR
jgi:hypothetical protein